MKEGCFKLRTAGYSGNGDLWFHPGPRLCGEITDGVSFEHDDEGPWVLSFLDLEACYLAARQARKKDWTDGRTTKSFAGNPKSFTTPC